VLARPFVYDRVPPLVVGGIDMSPVYERLEAGPEDVIVDVGCGTGDALRHLPSFRAYHGFDVDPAAIEAARARAASRDSVRFEPRAVETADLAALRPTLVVLAGLLHHLDDAEATGLLAMLAGTDSIRRTVTQDPVYLPREHVSNLLARLDRGRYVRDEQGYRRLVELAGLRVESEAIIRSRLESGRARYLVMTLSVARNRAWT
jgi:SAM-dependent methyltransferase